MCYLDDAKSRLIYTEKEFEQLKHDYYNLNLKYTDLLKTCAKLENENENLLNSFEQIKREKLLLTQKFENEIKQLNVQQKQELLTLHQKTDQNQINLERDIESLKLRINNYENVITQYEEYRIKLENNLQKITQQRDTNKVELRITKEMLMNKENDYNQLKIHFDQCEKHLQTHQEQFRQYENTINELEQQYKQDPIRQVGESNSHVYFSLNLFFH
jgi:chromosome segregation ATPase